MRTIPKESAIRILKAYHEFEGQNKHSANYVILANVYGDSECKKDCIENREFAYRNGYADPILSSRAYEATKGFYQKLVEDAKGEKHPAWESASDCIEEIRKEARTKIHLDKT